MTYSEDEVSALLKFADPIMRVFLLLSAHAGLRVSETLALTWGDVDLNARKLTVKHGKGGKARGVQVSRTLAEALGSLQAALGAPDKTIIAGSDVAARKRLQTLCKRAGVAYKGVHALRHYAGTKLVRQTGDLERAARHLGHSSIETTRIYAKWSDDALKDSVGEW